MSKNKKPELAAPAGDWKMLTAAIKSGANAVYFGIDKLNMRAKAENFKLVELPEIVNICKKNNVSTHLTLNTIVYEHELDELKNIITSAKEVGIDMIICWDMSVIKKCVEYNLPFCVSTQASISNSHAAGFYKKLGAKRIVLARECTLEQIIEIKKNTNIEIETFIHGAMCIAESGRCLLSHEVFGKSANRGECLQPCRREYSIVDIEEKHSLIIGESYVLSPTDLCTIDFIDKLIGAGIDAFKIEGRKRSPEYIAKVVAAYREAIDLYFENKLSSEAKAGLIKKLSEVYNRGFSSGFYFGTPGEKDYSNEYGSKATTRKLFVGKVLNYYNKSKIAYMKISSNEINIGDNLYVIGKTTGVVEIRINSMMKDDQSIHTARRGDDITFPCSEKVRMNDQVYKIIELDNE